MENQTTAPAQGKMERKFPALYSNRTPIMLSHYELIMLIIGMREEVKIWDRLLSNVSISESDRYDLLEVKLHRSEMLERLEAIRNELYPVPF